MHLLDRPILHALKTRQSALAIGRGKALRFDQEYTPFAAAEDDGDEAIAALGALIPAEGFIVLLQRGGSPVPPGCIVDSSAECVQMVLETPSGAVPEISAEPLGDDDAADMLALARLTEPGPFSNRTHTLGQFYGVRDEGRLLAMAGERMKLPGYTEVSGVATHPDARGRGYAGGLIRRVIANIVERSETPFLHAYATNAGAIRLYESLGFRIRCTSMAMMLRPA